MFQYSCHNEVEKPRIILVHRPGEETYLAVTHPIDFGFDPSLEKDFRSFDRWLKCAQEEHDTMVSLLKSEGIQVLYMENLLSEAQGVVIQYLHDEIKRVRQRLSQFESKVRRTIEDSFEKLVEMPVCGLLLGLEASESFRNLSYDTKLEVYKKLKTLMPQTSLYYTQDPVISVPAGLVRAKMSMWVRRQEPGIVELALGKKNYVYRPRNRVEGGDVTIFKERMFVGIGALSGKGILEEFKKLVQTVQAKSIIFFFVPDYFEPHLSYAAGNVMHLDTLLMPIDGNTILCNKRMLEKTVVVINEQLFSAFEWAKKNFEQVVEVPDEEQQGVYGWGSNVLPLGNGKVLSSIHLKITNRNLREAGFNVYETESATLTSGFGSFHCMTAYLK